MARLTTDETQQVDVRAIVCAARGLPAGEPIALPWGLAAVDLDAGALALAWTSGDSRRELARVELAVTRPRFGGWRFWARCPNCIGRAAVLYIDQAGPRCRGCAALRYRSQDGDRLERALWRLAKVRAALGAAPSPLAVLPERPRGVRRRTWARLLEEHAVAMTALHGAVQEQIGRLQAIRASGLVLPATMATEERALAGQPAAQGKPPAEPQFAA